MWNGTEWQRGDRVVANYDGRGVWRGAEVFRANPDGTYDLLYDEGMSETSVPAMHVRMEPAYPALDETIVPTNSTFREPWDAADEGRAGAGVTVGTRVEADYSGIGYFHPATVNLVYPDGTFELVYDDGLREDRVPLVRIRTQEARVAEERAAPPPRAMGRMRARTPPGRAREPRPAAAEVLRVGSLAQGNWGGLGYWHPATVMALLPGGAFLLRYEDGYEEEAAAECVLPAGSEPTSAPAPAEWDGSFGSDDKKRTPLAPRRRQASGVHDAEKVRKQFEQERKARLEVVKLKAEDKQWAAQHGVSGDRGLFQGMIARWRAASVEAPPPPPPASDLRLSVFVRSRPLLPDEVKAGAFDVVTPSNRDVGPLLVVHEPKTMVDLSKAMDNHTYKFDAVFGENASNKRIFETALRPMVKHLFSSRGGHGTCFAYGQTGSGKTVTMEGLGSGASNPENEMGMYAYVAGEVFHHVAEAAARGSPLVVRCGFVEIYRGKCFDLLARKKKIEVMEDERGQQCLVGLHQVELESAEQMLQLLGQSNRTTRATAQNETSSRSHAILQLSVVTPGAQAWSDAELRCKLSLVDLAGSEWAAKAQSDDRNNRLDGAEINKSLLCLKECIRALGAHGTHVPFRGSKLTQVLKDSFVGRGSRTVMIANISPSSLSCDHSLNTLRYAQRVKDWQSAEQTERRARDTDSKPPLAPAPAAPQRQPQMPPLPPQESRSRAAERGVSRAGSARSLSRNSSSGAREAEPVPPEEAECEELSRSLRWSPAQVDAERAAKLVLRAEESLVAAHAASIKHAVASLPAEEKLLAASDGDMEDYVKQLKAFVHQKRAQLDAVEDAIAEYEQQCAREDDARRRVKGVNKPWD
ncbi:hypothetical protein AB1Y20_005919 [Prymnesium parvum]|uniref:Kinesin motor domain-containing protein n=1 Tax=Prymnesium parvum TaxID=97485 RepID=A0AB34J0X1_PRYPA